MRFEVKGGGIAAIVFAITLLSGVVFVMGLLAGYDVGRQAQIDTAQLATSYPLQSTPSAGAPSNPSSTEPGNPAVESAALTTTSPSAGSTPATVSSAAGDRTLTRDSVSPKRKTSQSGATPAQQRIASTSVPSTTEPPSSTAGSSATDEGASAAESENSDTSDTSSEASSNPDIQARHRVASTASSTRHKPYNIRIQAAMDMSGADQMMTRLQKLGYPSHLVPTEIAGQRWYKVEVGPYATPEEASNAEAQLRRKYDTAYGGVAGDNSAGQTSADDNPEE
jgi:cell division protein FtsN